MRKLSIYDFNHKKVAPSGIDLNFYFKHFIMTVTIETPDKNSVTVADIALNFPHAVDVLNKYGLDYCCNGKKLFVDACKKANLDAEKIWEEVLHVKTSQGPDGRIRFDTWDVPLLIDFIIQHHHQYVRKTIPQIQELLHKVYNAHHEDSPEVIAVRENFNQLADELLSHMEKEEQVLFPAMRRLFISDSPARFSEIPFNLQAPISVMEHEHDEAGELIKSIRRLTQHYTAPEHACPTFQLAYKMLHEFDNDLMQHIHLENNILFPRIKTYGA